MYDELVALLRKKYDKAPMVMEAADAIEGLREAERKYLHNISVLESEAESLKRRFVTFTEQVPQWMPLSEPPVMEVRPINYTDCSNAMLKMWMDRVVTDGEYSRIMDKLNAWYKEAQDDV